MLILNLESEMCNTEEEARKRPTSEEIAGNLLFLLLSNFNTGDDRILKSKITTN